MNVEVTELRGVLTEPDELEPGFDVLYTPGEWGFRNESVKQFKVHAINYKVNDASGLVYK